MRAYLDSSALVKRALAEAESTSLADALDAYVHDGTSLVTSKIGEIEVSRAIRARLESEPPASVAEDVRSALLGLTIYPLDDTVVGIARRLGSGALRSLDAIHLATAAIIDADVVVAYDERLLRFAEELGFVTSSPGLER